MLFAPWLEAERISRAKLNQHQRNRRRDKRLQVKIGHGGTLDPLATGVLIIGVGKGTKQLQTFLECTKAYEATLLFGVATDTYDVLGKVLSRAPYAHLTREKVEQALAKFRGQIMQRPPIFSARRVQGKHLYEYAREGKEVPVEIEERPVQVMNLDIEKWLEAGSHDYRLPKQEAEEDFKKVAGNVLHLDGTTEEEHVPTSPGEAQVSDDTKGVKRKRIAEEDDNLVFDRIPTSKRREVDTEIFMSGGLQISDDVVCEEPDSRGVQTLPIPTCRKESPLHDDAPPAVKLRMTVTSGFYVRSLCHDLGVELGSLGIMADLIRKRQGDFEVGENVLDYDDLSKGEEVWGPRVERMLNEWQDSVLGPDGRQSTDEER